MLMWSPLSANRGSVRDGFQFSVSQKSCKTGDASGRTETWGFPSLGAGTFGLPPHPLPEVSSFLQGRGGFRGQP